MSAPAPPSPEAQSPPATSASGLGASEKRRQQILRRSRQDQTGHAIDPHQHESRRQDALPRLDERPHLRERFPSLFGLRALCLLSAFFFWCHGSSSKTACAIRCQKSLENYTLVP